MLMSRLTTRWIAVAAAAVLVPAAVYATKWLPPSNAERIALAACDTALRDKGTKDTYPDELAVAKRAVAECEKASDIWNSEAERARINLVNARTYLSERQDIETVFSLVREEKFSAAREKLGRIGEQIGEKNRAFLAGYIEKADLIYIKADVKTLAVRKQFRQARILIDEIEGRDRELASELNSLVDAEEMSQKFENFSPNENVRHIFWLKSKYSNNVIYKNEDARRIVQDFFMECMTPFSNRPVNRYVPLEAILHQSINEVAAYLKKKPPIVYIVDSINGDVRISDFVKGKDGRLENGTVAFEINKWGDLRSSSGIRGLQSACSGIHGPIWVIPGKDQSLSANSE